MRIQVRKKEYTHTQTENCFSELTCACLLLLLLFHSFSLPACTLSKFFPRRLIEEKKKGGENPDDEFQSSPCYFLNTRGNSYWAAASNSCFLYNQHYYIIWRQRIYRGRRRNCCGVKICFTDIIQADGEKEGKFLIPFGWFVSFGRSARVPARGYFFSACTSPHFFWCCLSLVVL